MKSEQIKYFLEAAELGSMLQVAQKNFMSQPGISKAIAELEKELDVKLLNRSRQGISLTEAGKIAKEEFSRIEKQIAALRERLAPYHDQKINEEPVHIEVYASPEMNATIMQSATNQFHRTYPNAVFEIREYDFMEMMSLAARNQTTFGVFSILEEMLTTPKISAILKEKRLQYQLFAHGQLSVILSPSIPLARKKAIALKDILCCPLVIFNSYPDECWHDIFLQQHCYTLHPIHTNSTTYFTNLIENQGYLGFLLNTSDVPSSEHQHKLIVRPIKEHLQVVTGVIHHEEASFTSPLQDFLCCLRECIGSEDR